MRVRESVVNKSNNSKMAQQVNPPKKEEKKKSGRRPSQLSHEELQQLKAAFKFFDKDGNGTVEPEEISEVMKVLGVNLTLEELTDIMANLDENGDGIYIYIYI